ncbi:putative glutamate N-acetyltransferase precursor [Serendipita vermifera]|nr:putative glutamate N-acetyltransferase precursor [Serendipita vermifera]
MQRSLAIAARSFSTSAVRQAKTTPSKAHLAISPLPENIPKGFLATGIHAGVKKKEGVLDLALIVSKEKKTSAAACFTRNAFQAAPVIVCQDVLQQTSGRANALVVNSGCANAVTGKQGLKDAWDMVSSTDKLRSKIMSEDAPQKGTHQSLVMSTGVIGQNLPISKIVTAIQDMPVDLLQSTPESWERAAKAFMTTDTFPKLRARTFKLGETDVRIIGMDKGAGMIHPDMGPSSPPPSLHATLLGVIATDAAISPPALQEALTYAVDRSFNSISVDGDMSTNDTVVVLANGASGMQEIDDTKSQEFIKFRDELTRFAADLAQLVVRDGEGATKFVTVNVRGALTYEDAHQVASKISTSALVKTALYGEDANWGRILAATGSTHLSAPITPNTVSVFFIPSDGSPILPLLKNGEPEKVDEDRAKEILQKEDLEIRVELGMGNEEASYWTCDFSHEYVTINGDYRS